MQMVAKRNGPDFELFADGFFIGKLVDCEVCFVFQSEDEELEDRICHRLQGDMSVRELLAEVRAGYEDLSEFIRLEHEAEMRADEAWVRAYENYWDPEAQADLEFHNFLHPNGYRY